MKTKQHTGLMILIAYFVITMVEMRCSSSEDPKPFDCNSVTIDISTTEENPSSCTAADGSIEVVVSGGSAPYEYAVDGGAFGSGNAFANLGAGTYEIAVKDAKGCMASKEVILQAPASTLAITLGKAESGCKTSSGSITVTATGGNGPYQYKMGNGLFESSNVFSGLAAGNYTITVKDADGCTVTETENVTTGIDYENDIKQILNANCAVSGCHVSGGSAPMALGTFAAASPHAAAIKTQVLSNNMPKGGPPLSQELKDKIACWVDDGAPQN